MIQSVDLSKRVKQNSDTIELLSNINLSVNDGEYVSILGKRGSGKTTLFNILGLLDNPSNGKLLFDQKDVSQLKEKELVKIRRGNISYVYGDSRLIESLTVFENVELPLLYLNVPKSEREERVAEVLAKVNLLHRKSYYPADLSLIQSQLVSISRAMVIRPKLILADEPARRFSSSENQLIFNIFNSCNESGVGIVLFTESKQTAGRSQRLIQLHDGHIVS